MADMADMADLADLADLADSIPRVEAGESSEGIVAALQASGVVVVPNFVSESVLERVNRELDPYLAAVDTARPLVNPSVTAFFGPHTRQITGVASKSATFADEILCHPVLMAVCDAILLPSCSRYQLNLAHVLDRGPGAEQQLIHRDEAVWAHFPKPHPELQLASIIALEDFSAENGATLVVPGSHRWAAGRQPEPDEAVPAEMPAGAAVIYLGSTFHAGGPNTTANTRRRGMHLSYTLGWLRTEENHYLATPPAKARTLPRRVQALLGYAAHDAIEIGGGYLGAVDVSDPIEMLAAGEL